MTDCSIVAEIRGTALCLTVDRQEVRNAYAPDTLRRLAEQIHDAPRRGVRAVILTGAGSVSFSSGMDLRALRSEPGEKVSAAVAEFQAAFDDPDRLPIIAAVNGDAKGGGFETALRCDLVVTADHAMFGLPEVRHGLIPGGGATLLPARLPIAVAMELAIAGLAMPAQRAYELGLVNRVVPRGSLLDVAQTFAESIASGAPHAVAKTRSLLWTTLGAGAEQGWADTKRAVTDPRLRDEMAEGVAAFAEKRPPRWVTASATDN